MKIGNPDVNCRASYKVTEKWKALIKWEANMKLRASDFWTFKWNSLPNLWVGHASNEFTALTHKHIINYATTLL
jgi:hypothetical protein